jgi:hypothetical protein
MTSSKRITIGFSTHRPETLPFATEQMQRHDAIILEEPEIQGFEQMLKGNLSIENYLRETDFEYPEFARRSCGLFQTLYQNGKHLFQIDPFITQLNAIHDFFASGGTPPEIESNTIRNLVYNAERDYSAALLAYYEKCLTAPFDEVVDLVKRFAREDARRGRLRDQMRAEAIVAIIPPYESVYVEAGLLHLSLLNRLAKALPAEYCIRPVYLMAPVVRQLNARRQALGPGDKLTLLYTYRPDYTQPRADRLAAQSLIYTKILIKEEMVGAENSFPHTRNEVESSTLVRPLTYSNCEALYARIKNKTTNEARKIVRPYLDR